MSSMTEHTRQLRKFGWYGLLKNLKWFEPYLLLFLLEQQLSFVQIGILFAIRETTIYLFEIPSGVIADRYGKKKELILSFAFYIVSFVGFFLSGNFWILILPMVLFGLGEAFRSGTHKAMIMDYLDIHHIAEGKEQVYGYTRSYSNIGSVVSSVFGIVLVLIVPQLNVLFLIAVVPYVADAILIWSYPDDLDQSREQGFHITTVWMEMKSTITEVWQSRLLRRTLLDSSVFTAMFKLMRDFIQPVLFAAGLGLMLIHTVPAESNARMFVGIAYAIAQFCSVFVTRNAHRLKRRFHSESILLGTWLLAVIGAMLIWFLGNWLAAAAIGLLIFYVAQNIRKPFMVDRIGTLSLVHRRSSVLSIESQMSSVFIIVFAPFFGWIADQFGLSIMFAVVSLSFLLLAITLTTKKDA